MQEKPKILIVEDLSINRRIIRFQLQDEFDVCEAENGLAALKLLAKSYQDISCILLDLIMPVMDGVKFLERFTAVREYANIPVLVATAAEEAEKKCYDLGAWDFIRKPYDAELLRLRLKNVIGRSQRRLLKQIRHMAEHDQLTGLSNRANFLQEMRATLDRARLELPYVLIRIDIRHFRLINTLFGSETGDHVLCYLAKGLDAYAKSDSQTRCGRMEADVFCLLAPYENAEVERFAAHVQQLLSQYKLDYYLEAVFGVYRITDRNLSVETMYGHAAEASQQCKRNLVSHVVYYSAAMSEFALREQAIMNEAPAALKAGEFEVYLQPKYDLSRR